MEQYREQFKIFCSTIIRLHPTVLKQVYSKHFFRRFDSFNIGIWNFNERSLNEPIRTLRAFIFCKLVLNSTPKKKRRFENCSVLCSQKEQRICSLFVSNMHWYYKMIISKNLIIFNVESSINLKSGLVHSFRIYLLYLNMPLCFAEYSLKIIYFNFFFYQTMNSTATESDIESPLLTKTDGSFVTAK